MRTDTALTWVRPVHAKLKDRLGGGTRLPLGGRIIGGIFAAVAMASRLMLPFAIRTVLNKKLARIPGYQGEVGDVELHLFRGAYSVHDIKISKTDGGVPVPFFSARTLDFSLNWQELIHGVLGGEVHLVEPEINIVADQAPKQPPTGKRRSLSETLGSIYPFRLKRIEIHQGKVRFGNPHSDPPMDLFVNNLTVTATNVTNIRDGTQKLPSGIKARGDTLGEGKLELKVRTNLMSSLPALELEGELKHVNLTALNNLLKVYGKFEVAQGTLTMFSSLAVADGKYEGYSKVFLEHLDVFAWEKERKKHFWEVIWHAVVGGLASVFKNQAKDRIALKIPLSGSFNDPDIDVWTAVSTLLRNAFVSALVPKRDESIKVEQIKE